MLAGKRIKSVRLNPLKERRAGPDPVSLAGHQLVEAQQIAALGSWEIDFSRGFWSLSPEARRLFRWSAATIPSVARILASVHPDDRVAVGIFFSTPQGGKPAAEECFFRLLDEAGRVTPVYARARAALTRGGQATRLVGTVQDMSRVIELESGAHQQAQIYRGIFDNSVWGIFQTTGDGNYLTANPALARIYGYDTVTALLSALTDISDQLYVDPTRRDAFVTRMHEKGIVSGFESQVYRRDRSIIWISESCREVRTSGGKLMYYEGMVEEITERKRVEEELRAAKEAAETANRSKSEFLGTMSHELRTPLNHIIGFSEMMEQQTFGALGNPRYLDYCAHIRESGQTLLSLISDVLDMSRIEAGRMRLERKDVEIGEVVSTGVEALREKAQEKDIELTFVPFQRQSISADRNAVAKVLDSLLRNAIKFTPEGGRVTVRGRRVPGGVNIYVEDTGIGISRAELDRVAKPFEQSECSLENGMKGSGLGLAIARSLVELHGGSLRIRSTVGTGTIVRVRLPNEQPTPVLPFPDPLPSLKRSTVAA